MSDKGNFYFKYFVYHQFVSRRIDYWATDIRNRCYSIPLVFTDSQTCGLSLSTEQKSCYVWYPIFCIELKLKHQTFWNEPVEFEPHGKNSLPTDSYLCLRFSFCLECFLTDEQKKKQFLLRYVLYLKRWIHNRYIIR